MMKPPAKIFLVGLAVTGATFYFRSAATFPDSKPIPAQPVAGACTVTQDCKAPVASVSPQIDRPVSTAQAVIDDKKTVLPREGDARERRALELINEGRPEAAVSLLEDILISDPNNETALVELGSHYSRNASTRERAEKMLRKALEVDSESQPALEALVSMYRKAGKEDEVPEMLKGLQASNPSSGNYAAAIGGVLMSEGNSREAIPHLETAAAQSYLPAQAYSTLAAAHLQSGSPKDAAVAYEKAISAHTEMLEQFKSRGLPTNEIKQDLQRSRVALIAALRSSGQNEKAEALSRFPAE